MIFLFLSLFLNMNKLFSQFKSSCKESQVSDLQVSKNKTKLINSFNNNINNKQLEAAKGQMAA